MMNSRTRRVLAVMAVTTALCADQAVVAAQSSKPVEIGQIASRIVTRLTQNLRRTMPGAIYEPARQEPPTQSAAKPQAAAALAFCRVHAMTSPFQFRLPPPLI